jgi:hypothetical protein
MCGVKKMVAMRYGQNAPFKKLKSMRNLYRPVRFNFEVRPTI